MKCLETGGGVTFREGAEEWRIGGVFCDAGIDGAYLRNTLAFESYDGFCATAMPAPKPTGMVCTGFGASFAHNGVTLILENRNGRLFPSVRSLHGGETLTGWITVLCNIPVTDEAWLEFPSNLPWERFRVSELKPLEPVSMWFAGTAMHLFDGERDIDLLYRNATEKFIGGAWLGENGLLNLFFLAAAECTLSAGETQHMGELAVLLPEGDPYRAISGFCTETAPRAGKREALYGPMYCCHPAGTTDTDYATGLTLPEYAAGLPALREMGIRTVYVLPVYAHRGHNDIYSPTDLGEIDARYGGRAGAAEFVQAAHREGLRVIFDFVPHGPEPDSDMAKRHPDWLSRRQDGSPQLEWDCVCFDPCNPDYIGYLRSLVRGYATDLALDGMRIDCAMGGCVNHRPHTPGTRASASTLAGGIRVTEAVRRGFDDAGREALIMPEMTYAVPDYLGATECFYNNTLYRVLMNLNEKHRDDRVFFTQSLLRWLEVQHRCRPAGQVMANWLENHDTVLWAGDARRAWAVYGEGLCENMFRLISWIDGFPVIYQGDENPAAYGLPGRDLRGFFRETFALREQLFPYDAETVCLPSESAVFAFRRIGAAGTFTVLLNLSGASAEWAAEGTCLFADRAGVRDGRVLLSGYGAVILKENGRIGT